MDFDKLLINEYFNILNQISNKEGCLTIVKSTNLSNELLETLKVIENCTSCKDNPGKYNLDEFHKLINKIENYLAELEEGGQGKEDMIRKLNGELIETDYKLSQKLLCE